MRPLKLRMGMVGGGQGAFIGAVHRMAATLDGEIELVAGALSSTPERSRASGEALGLPDERNYGSWQDMLAGELAREDRIDLVAIVTPNHLHYPVAKAFAEAGIHVVCDKPLVHTSEQAQDLVRVVNASGVVFAVTYNYTGYPMVKQARHMVRTGQLGDIRKVAVEYRQGWLAGPLEGNKQADWRTDPSRSGLGGAVGDIGTHAENLMSAVTGLELEAVCADLTAFVPGRMLDDDASALLRFRGGGQRYPDGLAGGDRRRERPAPARSRHEGQPELAAGGPQPPAVRFIGRSAAGADAQRPRSVWGSAGGHSTPRRAPRGLYRGLCQRVPGRRHAHPGQGRGPGIHA